MSEAESDQTPSPILDELGPDTEEEAQEEEAQNPPGQEPAQEPGEGEGEAEPVEGHPAEPQAVSQKQIEQVWKKFEKSSQVWRKRVAEIMGGDVDVLALCPLCDPLIPGYVMPAPDTPERFPAVRQFMGDAEPEEWLADPQAHRCETCNGYGVVETGSRVQGQERLTCTTCKGFGWTGSRGQVSQVTGPTAQVSPEANGPTGPGLPEVDPPEVAKLKQEGYMVVKLAQPTG